MSRSAERLRSSGEGPSSGAAPDTGRPRCRTRRCRGRGPAPRLAPPRGSSARLGSRCRAPLHRSQPRRRREDARGGRAARRCRSPDHRQSHPRTHRVADRLPPTVGLARVRTQRHVDRAPDLRDRRQRPSASSLSQSARGRAPSSPGHVGGRTKTRFRVGTRIWRSPLSHLLSAGSATQRPGSGVATGARAATFSRSARRREVGVTPDMPVARAEQGSHAETLPAPALLDYAQGVTAAWCPFRCKFGSAGAGAESPLNRLQLARSASAGP
jgi:hypothetical protein